MAGIKTDFSEKNLEYRNNSVISRAKANHYKKIIDKNK